MAASPPQRRRGGHRLTSLWARRRHPPPYGAVLGLDYVSPFRLLVRYFSWHPLQAPDTARNCALSAVRSSALMFMSFLLSVSSTAALRSKSGQLCQIALLASVGFCVLSGGNR